MKILPGKFRKTLDMTFPADGIVVAFFGARSPGKTYCADRTFISGCSGGLMSLNDYLTQQELAWIAFKDGQILLRSWRAIPFLINRQQTRHPLADSFLVPSFSWRIISMRAIEMFTRVLIL